jgi:hypothetical protein
MARSYVLDFLMPTSMTQYPGCEQCVSLPVLGTTASPDRWALPRVGIIGFPCGLGGVGARGQRPDEGGGVSGWLVEEPCGTIGVGERLMQLFGRGVVEGMVQYRIRAKSGDSGWVLITEGVGCLTARRTSGVSMYFRRRECGITVRARSTGPRHDTFVQMLEVWPIRSESLHGVICRRTFLLAGWALIEYRLKACPGRPIPAAPSMRLPRN